MRVIVIFVVIIAVTSCIQQMSAQLEGKVLFNLERDPRTTLSSLNVSHQGNGEVEITGDVSSQAERAAVTEIAMAVSGVNKVINRCKAPPTPEDIIRDSLIPPKHE